MQPIHPVLKLQRTERLTARMNPVVAGILSRTQEAYHGSNADAFEIAVLEFALGPSRLEFAEFGVEVCAAHGFDARLRVNDEGVWIKSGDGTEVPFDSVTSEGRWLTPAGKPFRVKPLVASDLSPDGSTVAYTVGLGLNWPTHTGGVPYAFFGRAYGAPAAPFAGVELRAGDLFRHVVLADAEGVPVPGFITDPWPSVTT